MKPLSYVPTVFVLYEFTHFLQGPDQMQVFMLTLYLLTWRIWRAASNASRGQMGFNSAFKGLITVDITTARSPVLMR